MHTARTAPFLSVPWCTLPDMDDDSLATVIRFPLHRVSGLPPRAPEPDALADYWALVQRLAAERRQLAQDAR